MNWLFALLLGWHAPLEVPPTPPDDWPKTTLKATFQKSGFNIFLPATREVLLIKTTTIRMPNGPVIVMVTPEQMSILEASYPPEQVDCGVTIKFYAPVEKAGVDE